MIRLIWFYVSFKSGNITIRYIYDTQHSNIILILSYFEISPFFKHYFHYNIYAIILIYLHRTTGPFTLSILCYSQYIFLARPVKTRLFTVVVWFYRILRQQYGHKLCRRNLPKKRWVEFIDNHTTSILFNASSTPVPSWCLLFTYLQYICRSNDQ